MSFTKTGWRRVHVKVPSVQTGHGPDTSAEKEILVLVQVPKKEHIFISYVLPLFTFRVNPAVQGMLEILRVLSYRSAPGELYNR